jgi:hypothetical protein
MAEALRFLMLTLAVWRVTSLLHREDGPWYIFAQLRKFIGVYYDEFSRLQGRNVVARALTCFWCSSVYVAFPFAFLMPGYNPFVTWLALSAGAIFVDELTIRIERA